MTQAGWYPDPYGEAALRWWDGTIWTGHVHTGDQSAQQGQAAQQPVHQQQPQAAHQQPRQGPAGFVLDIKHDGVHCWADGQTINLHRRSMRIDEITWFAYQQIANHDRVMGAKLHSDTRYLFFVGADRANPRKNVSMEFSGVFTHKHEAPEVWTRLVRLSHDHLAPALLADIRQRLDRGESVPFGKDVFLDAHGIRYKKISLNWADIRGVRKQQGAVVVYNQANEAKLILHLQIPNVPLLPDLMRPHLPSGAVD